MRRDGGRCFEPNTLLLRLMERCWGLCRNTSHDLRRRGRNSGRRWKGKDGGGLSEDLRRRWFKEMADAK